MPVVHTQKKLIQVPSFTEIESTPVVLSFFVFVEKQSNLCSSEQLLLDDRELKMVTIINL